MGNNLGRLLLRLCCEHTSKTKHFRLTIFLFRNPCFFSAKQPTRVKDKNKTTESGTFSLWALSPRLRVCESYNDQLAASSLLEERTGYATKENLGKASTLVKQNKLLSIWTLFGVYHIRGSCCHVNTRAKQRNQHLQIIRDYCCA